MLATDPTFWSAVALTAALAAFTHYLMKHYHMFIGGWPRIGRYATGILCIAAGVLSWYVENQSADGARMLTVTAMMTLSAGVATLSVYAVDNTVDRERRGEDLRADGQPVE